jgi:uncharacterized membrane protein
MRIEHSIEINAPIETVWNIFTDLTCWQDWTSVMKDVSGEHDNLKQGKRFNFCIRPFVFPINIQPLVEELIPLKRIVWSGSKHTVSARHEFIFEDKQGRVELKSIETFKVNILSRLFFHIPKKKLHKLSVLMLEELKYASENPIPKVTYEEELWEKK